MNNNSRDLNLLVPELKVKCMAAIEQARGNRLFVAITSTARTVKCQFALYAQGRYDLDYVNALRIEVGLPKITKEENKKKVTWTLKSRHLIDLEDEEKDNDLSTAFDFVVLSGSTAVWSVKADVNKNNQYDYEEFGVICESYGLEWGGRWANPDSCHVQINL